MILWTVMPMETVFPAEYTPDYREVEYAGAKVMVEKTAAEEYRVVRILSTNPEDYLRQDIQPGTVFSAGPVLEGIVQ